MKKEQVYWIAVSVAHMTAWTVYAVCKIGEMPEVEPYPRWTPLIIFAHNAISMGLGVMMAKRY